MPCFLHTGCRHWDSRTTSPRKALDARGPTLLPIFPPQTLSHLFFSSKCLICPPPPPLLLRASISLTLWTEGCPQKDVLQPTQRPDVWGWYRDPGKDGRWWLHLSLSHSVWDTVGQTQPVRSRLPRLFSGCFKGVCHVVVSQVGPDTLAIGLI